MSKRIVIVSGGKLEEKVCLPLLEGQEEGYVIGVDKGVEFLYNHQIMQDYIVGAFDSVKQEIVDYYRNETHVGIREFNPVKDASDTEIAIRLAMTLGGTDLVILGATGGRADHMMGNVQLLYQCLQKGVFACLLDPQNKIYLLDGASEYRKSEVWGKYISFLPLTERVFGITLEGFKYPLTDRDIEIGTSLCISNELARETGRVEIRDGVVICVESHD